MAYNLCQHQQHTIFQCIIVLSLSLHPEVHCVQKNKTRIIFNIMYSCKSIADLQWNLACDILMILAIKRIHNLPPHLSYVSTLPDVTQNRNTALTSWSRSSLTLGTIFLRASSTKPLANMVHACVKAKGRHFEHLLWFSHTTGSNPLQTHRNQFFSEPLTLLRGRQHNSSVFV